MKSVWVEDQRRRANQAGVSLEVEGISDRSGQGVSPGSELFMGDNALCK